MKKETLQKGMILLTATFPDKHMEASIFWELLHDLDDMQFLLAIKDICSSTEDIYPGTNIVAKIRKSALSTKKLLSGESWEQVLKQVSSVGSYGNPDFDDVLTAKAVACIGWKTICQSELISVERAHFIKIYDQLLSRDVKEEVQLPECKQINQKNIKAIESLTKGVLK